MSIIPKRRGPKGLRLLVAVCLVASLTIPVGLALADAAGTRPPQCASHFKDRDVRERTIDAPFPGANLHEMGNDCAAAGQNLNILSPGSHFRLYYADTVQTYMCYGYSYQTQQNGYVYCSALKS